MDWLKPCSSVYGLAFLPLDCKPSTSVIGKGKEPQSSQFSLQSRQLSHVQQTDQLEAV